jgi:hypothetical protein
MPRPPHSTRVDLLNDICGCIQDMKLLTLQLPQFSCYLIYVHSSSFMALSFSLTVNDHKRITFLFTSRDNGHRHQTPRLLTAYCSLMALFGFPAAADRSSYSGTNQCHQRLCANKPRTSSLVGVRVSARDIL